MTHPVNCICNLTQHNICLLLHRWDEYKWSTGISGQQSNGECELLTKTGDHRINDFF